MQSAFFVVVVVVVVVVFCCLFCVVVVFLLFFLGKMSTIAGPPELKKIQRRSVFFSEILDEAPSVLVYFRQPTSDWTACWK